MPKEVIRFGQYGICPRCGKIMGMLESVYTMYGLTPNGSYPNKLIEEERDITYACLCGARYSMKRTAAGIIPKDYAFQEDLKDKAFESMGNVIGYVKKEESKND